MDLKAALRGNAGLSGCSAGMLSARWSRQDSRQVLAGEASVAERAGASVPHRFPQPFQRKVADAIGSNVFSNLLDRVAWTAAFLARGRVDSVITRPPRGRARDPQVHFGGSGVLDHFHDLAGCRAAHN